MHKDNLQPTGGMGFFECIDSKEAAFMLFDTGKAWLLAQNKGIEAVDAPINFGERDSWWGCLVDGFHEPVYTMNYNHATTMIYLLPTDFKIISNNIHTSVHLHCLCTHVWNNVDKPL
jgi:hypothetical protein